jgi:hypothetical protein
MGPLAGKFAWTLVCAVLFGLAVAALAGLTPAFQKRKVELLVTLLAFSPVLLGILGGQLVALSMLIYVFMLVCDRKPSERVDLLLGAVIGSWLFKPQYALLAVIPFVLQLRFRVLAGFLGVALTYFLLGARLLGVNWISEWWLFARQFADMNLASNAHQMANLFGATVGVMQTLDATEQSMQVAKAAALAICALVTLLFVGVAWIDRTSDSRSRNLPSRALLLLGPVAVLASPLANFYDLGLAIIPLMILSSTTGSIWTKSFGLYVLFGFIASIFRNLGIPIFAILALALFIEVTRRTLATHRLASVLRSGPRSE